jgi:zinc protease
MRNPVVPMMVALFCLELSPARDLEIIALPEPASPFVAFRLWFRVGSQDDPPGKEGLAVLTGSCLAQGSTRSRSYDQILDELYPMATTYTVSVDKEMTVFSGLVHRDNLEGFYGLLRDAVLEPAFREDDFNRLKAQQLNYVRQIRRYSSDEELAKELLFSRIYRGTRYEHPEEGYVRSVEALNLDDVRDFYGRHYRRGNLVVGIGGSYGRDLPARIRTEFMRLPEGGTEPPPPPRPQAIQGIRVLIVEKETRATSISLGHPISLLRSDPDFAAMSLANSWLGEHRNSSSHLYQVIREARGMNYGDYSYVEAWPGGHFTSLPPVNVARRSQIFQIWIRPVSSVKEGDLHDRALFAVRAALRELTRLVEKGLSAEEFSLTQGFLRNYTVNLGSTLSRRLGYRLDDRFYGISDPGYLAGIRPGLEALTPDRVNEAVRRHLRTGDFWLVLITRDAEGLKRKLVSGEPTPISYPAPKPAAILEEDELISRFPIPVSAEDVEIVPIQEVFE